MNLHVTVQCLPAPNTCETTSAVERFDGDPWTCAARLEQLLIEAACSSSVCNGGAVQILVQRSLSKVEAA